jgi:hypothetical protein
VVLRAIVVLLRAGGAAANPSPVVAATFSPSSATTATACERAEVARPCTEKSADAMDDFAPELVRLNVAATAVEGRRRERRDAPRRADTRESELEMARQADAESQKRFEEAKTKRTRAMPLEKWCILVCG